MIRWFRLPLTAATKKGGDQPSLPETMGAEVLLDGNAQIFSELDVAWIFSSVADTKEFQKIFQGGTFVLEYTGMGETGILDEYYLAIMPEN